MQPVEHKEHIHSSTFAYDRLAGVRALRQCVHDLHQQIQPTNDDSYEASVCSSTLEHGPRCHACAHLHAGQALMPLLQQHRVEMTLQDHPFTINPHTSPESYAHQPGCSCVAAWRTSAVVR
eukprot:GHUV01028231.1.p1 GENE.GHUV01028231.1~~GHUV01028231.1.p1  ORF type:complete len:121 (+),score=12.29 GHUV01028231.1:599-961(+)